MNRGRGGERKEKKKERRKGVRGRGGERKEKKKERRKGEPVGIHRYFDCTSFIIYAGSSINY